MLYYVFQVSAVYHYPTIQSQPPPGQAVELDTFMSRPERRDNLFPHGQRDGDQVISPFQFDLL